MHSDKPSIYMIQEFIIQPSAFPFEEQQPWSVVSHLCPTIDRLIEKLGNDYNIADGASARI